MNVSKQWVGWMALGLLGTGACSEETSEADAGPSAGGTQASSIGGSGGSTSSPVTSGGGTGGTSNGEAGAGGCPEPALTQNDLFACDEPLSCPAVCVHNGLGDCGGDLACGEELYEDEEPGLLLLEARSGPGNVQSDVLTLILEGGGAIVQRRSRSCEEFPCDFDAIPWQVYQQELCDVFLYRACEAECEPIR